MAKGFNYTSGTKENGYYTPYLYVDGGLINNTIYAYYDTGNPDVEFTPPANGGLTSYNLVGTSKVSIVGTFLNTFNNALAWLGKISEIRGYNRALTVDEINHNFDSTKSRYGIT